MYFFLLAAASTSLALLSAITPRKPLRESDPFQVNSVSASNYRVWRGPAFWAQLTTLIMDMLQTSLIAIHVRVLFVQQQQHQQITTTCSTSDNEAAAAHLAHEVMVNPFFRVNSLSSPILPPAQMSNQSQKRSTTPTHHPPHHQSTGSRRHRPAFANSATPPPATNIAETSLSLSNAHHSTVPKVLAMSTANDDHHDHQPSTSSSANHYVNSKEVRQLKKLMSLSRQQASSSRGSSNLRSDDSPLVATSYCNPLFSVEHESSEASNNHLSSTSSC